MRTDNGSQEGRKKLLQKSYSALNPSSLPVRSTRHGKGNEPSNHQAPSDATKAAGFPITFFGYFDISQERKDEIQKAAHRELYKDLMGQAAEENATPAQIRRLIEAKVGTTLNIKFKAIEINQQDRSRSFANHMESIDQFLGDSRKRFIDDAIEQLSDLAKQNERFGDQKFQEKVALCHALWKVQMADDNRNPKIFGEHEAAFNALRSNANLKDAFSNAEGRLLGSTENWRNGRGYAVRNSRGYRDRSSDSSSSSDFGF